MSEQGNMSTPYLCTYTYFSFRQKRSSGKHRPAPPPPMGGGKPRPAPKPRLPMCKTLYTYEPQEADELPFVEGEMIEILKEGKWTLTLL